MALSIRDSNLRSVCVGCPYSVQVLFRIQTVVRTVYGYCSEYRSLSVECTGIVKNSDRFPYSAGVLFRIQTVVRTAHGYCSEYRAVVGSWESFGSIKYRDLFEDLRNLSYSRRTLFVPPVGVFITLLG